MRAKHYLYSSVGNTLFFSANASDGLILENGTDEVTVPARWRGLHSEGHCHGYYQFSTGSPWLLVPHDS